MKKAHFDKAAHLRLVCADGQEAGDAAKRGRALQKKLRQVQQLREKAAAGAKLEPDQLQKLESEPAITAELQALGLS